jgi:hypothetical protein
MEIVFSEVLAPMGHTVDFVDDKPVNFAELVTFVKGTDEGWAFDDFLRG